MYKRPLRFVFGLPPPFARWWSRFLNHKSFDKALNGFVENVPLSAVAEIIVGNDQVGQSPDADPESHISVFAGMLGQSEIDCQRG
ncbi:MAG: hypothetical protein Q9212_003987, partial [Teloschistes hypoglaucus]